MAMSKKGYFFSLIVLLLIGLATIIMNSASNPGYQRTTNLHYERTQSVQSFIDAIEQDAQTASKVATYRSLLAAQELLRKNEKSISKIQLEQLIQEGTYEGEDQPLIKDQSITKWINTIQTLAKSYTLTLTLTIVSTDVFQEDPWHVTTTNEIRLQATDAQTSSTWDQTFTTTTKTSIVGLADPLYTIKTNNRYTQTINKADEPEKPIKKHIEEHYYIATQNGPSYLDRLQGKTTASNYGIESLVNVPDLNAVNINKEGSIIDRHYLGTLQTEELCTLQGGIGAWAKVPKENNYQNCN